jgi:hypothetical protein
MYSDSKKSDLPDGPDQLGKKDDNPTIDDTIRNAQIAWTPGIQLPMIANIYTKSGITKSELPIPKQSAPIMKPLFNA